MIANANYLSDDVIRVKEAVKSWIRTRRLTPGARLPSQSEFVKMLRCSHSTIHKAMRSLVSDGILVRKVGHGTFISIDTFPSDSIPNFSSGDSLVQKVSPGNINIGSKTVLFCSIYKNIPPLNSPAYEILATAENKINQLTYKQDIKRMFIKINSPDEFRKKVDEIAPDGIIIDWEQVNEVSFSPLEIELFCEQRKIHVIHCFHYYNREHSLKRVVEIDNPGISVIALSYLHSLGHNNILLAATEKSHGFDEIRINAAIDYADANKINLLISRYKNGAVNDWIEAGKAAYAFVKKIAKENRPTAVFAMNDKVALAFIEEASKDGIKIPANFSVIGVDNEISAYLSTEINLTSVDPCRASVGEKAAKWMIDILHGVNDDGYSMTIRCKPKLIKRQSTTLYKKQEVKNEIQKTVF